MNMEVIELDEFGEVKKIPPTILMDNVFKWIFKKHPELFSFIVKKGSYRNYFYSIRKGGRKLNLFKILKKHCGLDTNRELKYSIFKHNKGRAISNKQALGILEDYIWAKMEENIYDFMRDLIKPKTLTMICNGRDWSECPES